MRMGWMLGSERWRWRGEERTDGGENGVRYMRKMYWMWKTVMKGMIPMKRILGLSLSVSDGVFQGKHSKGAKHRF